jgi:hypothetical protein
VATAMAQQRPSGLAAIHLNFPLVIPEHIPEKLLPIIKGRVLSKATVYTDDWKSYDGLVLGG